VGVSTDCPNFWGTPYYLRNGKIYGLHILYYYSQGQMEQKAMKNFRKIAMGVLRARGII